tara:strand:+ start:94115 stop:94351 length:237 start_codon:yes stop_codon:yes gene_type:complete
MHVELSLDNQNNLSKESEEQSPAEDTQRISGSQVACAFARIEQGNKSQRTDNRFQVLAVSMSAVSAVVAIYLVFVLVL